MCACLLNLYLEWIGVPAAWRNNFKPVMQGNPRQTIDSRSSVELEKVTSIGGVEFSVLTQFGLGENEKLRPLQLLRTRMVLQAYPSQAFRHGEGTPVFKFSHHFPKAAKLQDRRSRRD
jgi:hypothetical protein